MEGKVRLLIADDSRDFTNILKECLTIYSNIEIVGIAENGFKTIEMILQKKPDIVLLDIVMPELNGIEVLRQINQMLNNKPIVFIVSALGSETITMQALSLGAKYFFVKPLDTETIIAKIQEFFSI